MRIINLVLSILLFGTLLAACEGQMLVQDEQSSRAKTVDVDDFHATWHFQDDYIRVEISAPTTGWVALGFNPQDNIVQTNLVMGAVVDGQVLVEDQYVVEAGVHPPVVDIGGQVAISDLYGSEANGETIIAFTIPQEAIDQFHYDLMPQQEIFLICAYSQEDDFEHHSTMRKHVKVTL